MAVQSADKGDGGKFNKKVTFLTVLIGMNFPR